MRIKKILKPRSINLWIYVHLKIYESIDRPQQSFCFPMFFCWYFLLYFIILLSYGEEIQNCAVFVFSIKLYCYYWRCWWKYPTDAINKILEINIKYKCTTKSVCVCVWICASSNTHTHTRQFYNNIGASYFWHFLSPLYVCVWGEKQHQKRPTAGKIYK